MIKPQPAIVWYRQDLRLQDQPALNAAAAGGRPVVAVYVLDDTSPGMWSLGEAARWWLHHSLASLEAALSARGGRLVLRRGVAAVVLPALAQEIGATEVHAGRMHEPWARKVDAVMADALEGVGATYTLHRTSTLFDMDAVRTKTGNVYGVYTPFARTARALEPDPVVAAPARLNGPTVSSDTLASLDLLQTRPDGSADFSVWQVGEDAAHARLAAFLDRVVNGYDTARNLPGRPGTSMVSPHLHWGELSPGQVWHTARQAAHQTGQGLEVYLSEILWREFSAYLLWHHPHLPEQPLRPEYSRLPVRHVPKELHAWQHGLTGVPIVDAGMRQLRHIGWMHNRVRMIAASFLVKQLLMPWQDGSVWFWDNLVDADLASNSAGWQWIAGCGTDNSPFFRVFNPVTQGEKFDTDGAYVRHWVPELARLPDALLHQPWAAPAAVLAGAGILLGKTYPRPLVELPAARQRALDAFAAMRAV